MVRVSCAGDSLTALYPKELSPILGPAYAIENDGWGGSTLSTTGASPYRNRSQFTSALAWVKDGGIAIVQLGTNDGYALAPFATFPADCIDLMRDFQATAASRVLLVLPPPSAKFPGIDAMVIPTLRACAKTAHVEVVDVHAAFVGHPEWFSDGVHPNAEGDKVMARVIGDAVLHPAALTEDDASSSSSSCEVGVMPPSCMPSSCEASGCAVTHAGVHCGGGFACWTVMVVMVVMVMMVAAVFKSRTGRCRSSSSKSVRSRP